jgi:hypothetical protein
MFVPNKVDGFIAVCLTKLHGVSVTVDVYAGMSV